MAEYICLLNQDAIIIKTPKKSPLLLRMIVLVFAMVCGVYICSICLKQISVQTKIKYQTIQVIESPCLDNGNRLLENPSGHYPIPKTFNRGECADNPVRFFVILSMQRSGSGWFESLLNSHINVSSNGEIFARWYRRQNVSSIVQTMDKVYNLDWLSSASKNQCSAAVGFKWMLNQGLMENHKEIVEYFNRRGVSAIFLFRRNLLRRMVSDLANSYDRYAKLLNGTHKAHVHSTEEAEKLSTYKPTINSTSLVAYLEKMELTAATALSYFNTTRHMILYYEDVIKNRTKLKDVQEFLRLPVMELRSHQVKIHKGSISDHIKNWDDVNRTLKGTEYERFLHSDY
ncbi:Sulfotransferase domain containing protein [Parasponia andersonii]|uniref:Sulfotransferase n=1 Tax=Parasponia andersonii TaxID=3476 RepID=A0A2P5ATE5_PARAD|nr:Sulfotransferase domain containing protein [Parasponia andersonii]